MAAKSQVFTESTLSGGQKYIRTFPTSDSNPYSPNSPVSASRARTALYVAEDGVPVYYASARDFADSEGCDVYLR